MVPSAAPALPVTRDLRPVYAASLLTALLLGAASLAGLAGDPAGLYGTGSPLVQVSRGGDTANLLLGLPVLLGSMWLSSRGSLGGLLLWPGALFYVLYTDALYLVGAPFNALFLVYVALVTLSGWTLVGLVACVDLDGARRRLAAAPARGVGAALVVIALLAYAGLTANTLAALGGPAAAAGMRPQWIVDDALGTPALLLGGVLLWRRTSLGHVVAAGLLLVSGLNGLAFAVSAVLDGQLSGRAVEPAVIVVHLVIGAISLALLAFFQRRAIGRQAAGGRRTGVRLPEAAR
jgi:hypothetical protein